MNLTNFLAAFFKQQGFRFKLYDSYVSDEELFADDGLMVALVKQADRLCNVCYGYGLGVHFSEDSDAILGIRQSFDEETPEILRIMFIYEAVVELCKDAKPNDEGLVDVVLDDALYSI